MALCLWPKLFPRELPFPQTVCINVKMCFVVKGLVALEDLSTKEEYWWSACAKTPKNTNSILLQKHLTFTGPQLLGLKISKHTLFPNLEHVWI